MVKRKIIKIDTEKCNGCGDCIPNCPEGAIQLIDGKARLISDLFCDGLGACIGHCPLNAITIEKRDAEPYDEKKTMENIISGGSNVIKAHLCHLKEHGENEYLRQAIDVLKQKSIAIPDLEDKAHAGHSGCPGAKMMDFADNITAGAGSDEGERPSQLRQWPIQLHLISPMAPYFKERDVVLAADCVAYALGDFHKDYLKGKSLIIACPKLDEGQEIYLEKLAALIEQARINTLTVMTMEVPCCGGLLRLAQKAAGQSKRKIPIKSVVVGIRGDILKEDWL